MEINKVYHGDCMELLKQIPDHSIDCVITDPPYGVREDDWDLSEDEIKRFSMKWIVEVSSKTNKLITFWGSKHFHILFEIAKDLFQHYRIMIWHKPLGSQYAHSSNFGMFYGFEHIVMFYNRELKNNNVGELIKELRTSLNISRANIDIFVVGKKTGICYRWEEGACLPTKEQTKILTNIFDCKNRLKDLVETERLKLVYSPDITDVFSYRTITNPEHPTEKPLELIKKLISLFTKKDDLVYDPFLGSGTTAIACKQLQRRWIGSEKELRYIKIVNKRLSQTQLNDDGGTNFTKSSADDFPYQESLISVKQDSAESQNPPAIDERKKEADFV